MKKPVKSYQSFLQCDIQFHFALSIRLKGLLFCVEKNFRHLMQVFTLRIRRVKHLRHIAIFVVFGIPRVWRLSPWQQAEEALFMICKKIVWKSRAIHTRKNKTRTVPFIRACHLRRRVLAKPRLILDEMCRLYGKFASYVRRVLFFLV